MPTFAIEGTHVLAQSVSFPIIRLYTSHGQESLGVFISEFAVLIMLGIHSIKKTEAQRVPSRLHIQYSLGRLQKDEGSKYRDKPKEPVAPNEPEEG